MRSKRESGGDIISPIVSARINTRSAFGFRYGHLEVRAKLPRGDWIWPGKFYEFHVMIGDAVCSLGSKKV